MPPINQRNGAVGGGGTPPVHYQGLGVERTPDSGTLTVVAVAELRQHQTAANVAFLVLPIEATSVGPVSCEYTDVVFPRGTAC